MDKSPVLLTGATGFVGSCLAHRLVELGCEVHLILRQTSNNWRIKDILNRVEKHRFDLVDTEGIKGIVKKIKPEIIYHLAVYGGYPFQKDFTKIIQTNILGTVNLLNACMQTEFKCFVNTGSSSEYGPKSRPMKETDLLEPAADYGVSKASATLFCQSTARSRSLPIVTLRLFSPYGYYEEPTRLVPTIIKSCLKNENLKLADPTSVRDFIFIEDVIDAYLKAARMPRISGQIINIGSGKQHSVGEVVEKAIELAGAKVIPTWGSSSKRPDEPKIWVADVSKAKALLSWEPTYDLESGLKKTIKWFQKNISLYEK